MSERKENQKIEKLTKGLIGLLAYNILLPYNVTSYGAGVIVDPGALKEHRATIGKTANGIDQIDIAAPNNNGLSHNKFQEFNVDENGMILNNSAEMTLTRLAGLVYGNNNLAKGNEAKTILSEVTGIKRSEIEGFIEIAGKETEFILANPNGIYLSNGGFLNMSKTTLTTGALQDNKDDQLRFRINDGIVEVAEGGTINIEDVDYFEILSRAAKIGGVLSSSRTENRSTKELKVLTGDNTYNYDTGEYTSEDSQGKYDYAIDASEFGAVSAGKIKLIATDKGVGVNSQASMIATVGNLEIDSKGDIKIKTAVTRHGDVKIKSSQGSVSQQGEEGLIIAGNNLDITAAKDVNFEGKKGYAVGKNRVSVTGENVNIKNESVVTAVDNEKIGAEDIVIDARGNIKLEGKTALVAGNRLAASGKFLENKGTINGDNITIQTNQTSNSGDITAVNTLDIESGKILNAGGLTGKEHLKISGDEELINSGKILSDKNTEVSKFSKIINSGSVASDDKLSISEAGVLTNAGVIQAENILNVWGNIVNNSGRIYSDGRGDLTSDSLINEGLFYADGELTVTSNRLTNAGGGQIVSNSKNILIDAKNVNNSGQVVSKSETKIINGTMVRNSTEGQIISTNGGVSIGSGIISTEGLISGEGVKLKGGVVGNSGQIVSGANSTVINSTIFTNSGLMLSEKDTTITSDEILNKSNILAGTYFNDEGKLVEGEGTLTFTGEKIENEGTIKAVTGMQLTSKNITNSGTIKNVKNILSVDAENELLNSNSIYSEGSLDIDSKNSVVNTGDIYSKNQLGITTSNLNNQKNIQGNTVTLSGDVLENKNTGVIYSSADATVNIADITNEGNIFAKRTLSVQSDNLKNKAGAQIASNSIDVKNTKKVYNEGKIISQNDLNISTETLETQADSIIKGSTGVEITADKIINRGNILTEGTGNILTGTLENTETATLGSTKKAGSIEANIMTITADQSVNTGTIYSAGELNIKGNSLENTGNVSSIGNTTAILTILKNEGLGEIISAADLILNIEDETVNSGSILANRDILLTIKNVGLTNNGGIINASRNVSLVTKHVNNNNGEILSGQETKIHSINLENNGGKLISNGSLIIDLTQLGAHTGDYTLTGTVYGDQLIRIKNFNNIINNQIELMSNGDIEITSTDKNINNTKKIVAGKDLTLDAQKGYVINEGNSGEQALLSSGENLTLTAKNYINNADSKLYGGTGKTSIKLQETFDNKGEIAALGNIDLTVADGGNVTNSRKMQANGSLSITADQILLKGSTSVYATENIDLLARRGHIINEAGAQVLTLLGDIELKAAGNIYNKATTSKAGKIKAGKNVTVEAINFYNEAVKSSESGGKPQYDFVNMTDAQIWTLLLTNDINNGIYNYRQYYGGPYSAQPGDVGVVNNYPDVVWNNKGKFELYYTVLAQYFYKDYKNPSQGRLWDGTYAYDALSDNITVNSRKWENTKPGNLYADGYTEDIVSREMRFGPTKRTIKMSQSSLESGGDISMTLGNNLENSGVVRADHDINITAKEVINTTLEQQVEELDKMNVVFSTGYITDTNRDDWGETAGMQPIYDKKITKIKKTNSYVADDKALISAGNKVDITANRVQNTTTKGTITKSVEEYTGQSIDRNTQRNFENKKAVKEHTQTDAASVLGKQDNTAAKTPNDIEAPTSGKIQVIKGVDLVIDPKEKIDIPEGDSGIFVRNDDVKLGKASSPLIETNIDFINQDNYYGSGYVFEKLSENPQDYNRRLGDNYYETTLVNEMYLKATGGRKLGGGNFDEISLMKYLLDNSILASKELGLTVGQELTKNQMAKLDKDVVWYVTEEVDGIDVLVPKIYVTSNSVQMGQMAMDSRKGGSAISGEYVNVNTDKFENIGSTVNGNEAIKINADSILNKFGGGSEGIIKGGNISLNAVNDIKNIGAFVSGSGNVFLKTEKGSIINQTTTEREEFFDGYTDSIKDIGAIAGKNVVLDSGKDIVNTGGIVQAAEKISAKAKGNIKLDVLKLESKTDKSTFQETYKEDQKIHLGSSFKAGKGVYVAAEKDVDVKGSSIYSVEGDVIISGDNVNIEAVKNEQSVYYHKDKAYGQLGDGTVVDRDVETMSSKQENHLNASIEAGKGSVKIVSIKDLNIEGSLISGGKDVILSGDSVTVTAVKNTSNDSYNKDYSSRNGLNLETETITDKGETLANSSIQADKGSVKIVSNKDLNIIGSEISGGGDDNLLMSNEGNVNIKTIALKREYKREAAKRSFTSDSTVQKSGTVLAGRKDILNKHDDTGSDGSSNAKGGRFASAGINSSAESLHGKGYSTGLNQSKFGGSGGVTGVIYSSSEIKETLDATVHGRTTIKGGSVTIAAKEDVNLESVNIEMENTARIAAQEGDVNSTYVQDEIKTTVHQKNISIGISAGYNIEAIKVAESVQKQVDYTGKSEYSKGSADEVAVRGLEFGGALSKLSGAPVIDSSMEIGVSVSESNKETHSKDALDSKISAKNIIIQAGKGKVDFKGMQINGSESVAIDADSFNLEASKNEYHEKEDGYYTNVNLMGTGSVSLKGGPEVGGQVSVAASVVNAHTDSVTYNNATIKGKKVTLKIAKDANIKGGNISGDDVAANIGGNLNIESLQDTLDHHLYSTDVNGSVGVSVDYTGVPTPNGSVGVTHGEIVEKKTWVKTQSGIQGKNVNVSVGGNTNLKGGIIAAENGNLNFTTGTLSYEDLKDSSMRDGGYAGFNGSFSKNGLDSFDLKGGRVEGHHKKRNVNSTIGAGNVVVGGKKLEDTGSSINRDTDKATEMTQDEKHYKFDLDYSISPDDFKRTKKNNDSDVRKRTNDGDSDTPIRRVDVDGTDVVVRRRPALGGSKRTPDKVTSRPTVAVENKINIKVNTSVPSIDTGKRNKINTINPVIDSGKVTKVKITTPDIDTGKIKKIKIKQPDIDTGVVKKIEIDTPKIIPGEKIVDKINKPVTIDGEKTKVKMENLKKEIDETIKLRKQKLGISTPEYDTKLLKGTPKEEAGEPARIRDYTPKSEGIYDYTAEKGTEVNIGREIEEAIKVARAKGEDPFVATNKILAVKIKGQEDFFRNKGYKDSVGNNYNELQKNQLHKIVKAKGTSSMEALDKNALMKFTQDLDKYDQGLKAAKSAHDMGDTKAAKKILEGIKDFSNIKVDSPAFKKYIKEVKKKEQLKVSQTAVKNNDKKIIPTEKDIKEAQETGGYFIRKEKGKLVKYNIESTLKDTKFTDAVSGNTVTKDDFKTAEYNKDLGGKALKISEDGESAKYWLLKDGSDKPVIKEIPKYKFEKDSEKFRDSLTDKVFTKAELKEKGKIALDDSNTRFMIMDENGKVTIEKEVKLLKEGSEKLLDPKTGEVLRDASGKEINMNDFKSVSKTTQDFGGEKIDGTIIDLKDGRKVILRENGPEILTEEKNQKTLFVDGKTGLKVTEKDFEKASYDKELGLKVLKTNDPNRKLVMKDGESVPFIIEFPKTKLVPGSEFYVDSDTGAKVKPEDIKNAPVNKLLGQEAVKISDGRYFTLNDRGEVAVTQIDKVTELPGKVVDPKTESEMSDSEFNNRKEFNSDLDQEAVKISDGRYFVQDTDGKLGIREVSEVQERAEAAIDTETGKKMTKEDFDSSKKFNKELGEDAVDLGNGRYFVKDGDKIQIKELSEVQEKPETATDTVTNEKMTSDNFESKKKFNKELGQDAVDLGNGRYFVKDGDKIQIKEISEVQEKPETAIDPVTKQEITADNFESKKKYNKELGQDAVDLGNGRYFTKDETGNIKIATTEKNIESVSHIIDPKTKKEVTKEDVERSDKNNELDEKGIKIEDGRYFTLDKDGEVTITEIVKHDPNVYLDEKSSKKVSADDIKKGEFNDVLGEKAIKIDDNNYFVLNKKGEVEVAEITKEPRKDYDIIGEGFEKRITQEEYKALKDNPELNGKVVNLGDDKLLVMKADGEGYITNSQKLEKKVATETINTLLKDAISKNDSKRLKEVLNQGKENSRISTQMKTDLNALYNAGGNKKVTDKQLIERVSQYMEKSAAENYMDDKTGRTFDLNNGKFKKVKGNGKDKTKELKLNSKEKLIVDSETGEVKLRETKTEYEIWNGRKDWAVYKLFSGIFGKNKDKDADTDTDTAENLISGGEETQVKEVNPDQGRPLPETPKDSDKTGGVRNKGIFEKIGNKFKDLFSKPEKKIFSEDQSEGSGKKKVLKWKKK